jgi:hypothetical protein
LAAVPLVHERVEVPDPPEMFVGDNVHERLVELATTESVTMPVKLFTGETVIVDIPTTPVFAATLVGFAEIAKSPAPTAVKVTVAEWESVPLAPVTVTVKEPVADAVHDRVEVAEVVVPLRAILVELREQVRPVEGETVSDNVTVPVKPFVAATVIVEVPGVPTVTLTVVGLAVTVKFGAAVTANATVVEWEIDPLVPVTVTVNEPVAEPVQERVEVPELVVVVSETLAGLRVQVKPVDGEIVSVRATVPAKPLSPVTVMVEVPAFPTITLTLVGLAVTVKSAAAVTL